MHTSLRLGRVLRLPVPWRRLDVGEAEWGAQVSDVATPQTLLMCGLVHVGALLHRPRPVWTCTELAFVTNAALQELSRMRKTRMISQD